MFQLPKPSLTTLQVVDKANLKSKFMKISKENMESLQRRTELPIYGLIAVIAILIIIK